MHRVLFSKYCTVSVSSFMFSLILNLFQFFKTNLKPRLVLEISCNPSQLFDIFLLLCLQSSLETVKKVLEGAGPKDEPFSSN